MRIYQDRRAVSVSRGDQSPARSSWHERYTLRIHIKFKYVVNRGVTR